MHRRVPGHPHELPGGGRDGAGDGGPRRLVAQRRAVRVVHEERLADDPPGVAAEVRGAEAVAPAEEERPAAAGAAAVGSVREAPPHEGAGLTGSVLSDAVDRERAPAVVGEDVRGRAGERVASPVEQRLGVDRVVGHHPADASAGARPGDRGDVRPSSRGREAPDVVREVVVPVGMFGDAGVEEAVVVRRIVGHGREGATVRGSGQDRGEVGPGQGRRRGGDRRGAGGRGRRGGRRGEKRRCAEGSDCGGHPQGRGGGRTARGQEHERDKAESDDHEEGGGNGGPDAHAPPPARPHLRVISLRPIARGCTGKRRLPGRPVEDYSRVGGIGASPVMT